MTNPNVESFYAHAVAVAKQNLSQDNRLQPLAFIIARSEDLTPRVLSYCMPLQGELSFNERAPELICLCIPLCYDGDGLYDYIPFLSDEPGAKASLDEALSIGERAGIADAKARLIRIFLKHAGFGDGKDLCAGFLAKLCHDSHAEAIVKIDEAYHRHDLAPPAGPVELSKDLSAGECLMAALETRTEFRMTVLPFSRTVRDTGRIESFGEPIVQRFPKSGCDPAAYATGRFTSLLESFH